MTPSYDCCIRCYCKFAARQEFPRENPVLFYIRGWKVMRLALKETRSWLYSGQLRSFRLVEGKCLPEAWVEMAEMARCMRDAVGRKVVPGETG